MILIDTPTRGWSHMVGSDIKSLHEFAKKAGVKRFMFSNKRGKKQPHYDIRVEDYQHMIDMGAIPVNRRDLFTFLKENYS